MNLLDAPVESTDRPLDKLMSELLPSVRKLLGMEVAFVSEFYEGRRVFRYVDAQASFQPIAVGGSDPLEDSYCQRVVDGRLPELIQDATGLPEALKLPATLALPVGAHLSVPIKFSNGRVFGTFCCFSRQADSTLGSRDLATMRFFAETVSKVLEERDTAQAAQRETIARLADVLAHHEHSTAFQPIWDVVDDRIVGYEALARFDRQPYLPPDQWIAEAASVGLLARLEQHLHRDALIHLPKLPADAYLSLNVTPDTVLAEGFAARFDGYPLERLVLEITEHDSIKDYERIESVLGPLRWRGLRLAVDDAGAGFASFRHILRLKADIIKLDRSLIQDIDANKDSQILAAALLQFADQVGSRVVAEGVETQEELQALRRLGIRLVQGYLLGLPERAETLWPSTGGADRA